jgi:hypothetical protein
VPFRDGVAFPSDQGLHIFDRTSKNHTLISAVGDMHNSIALSALISPSKDGKTVNIVANMWDWGPTVSFDGGASWLADWPNASTMPASGEGGGGVAMGASPYQIMFHHSDYWASADGGENFFHGTFEGIPSGAFDYVRTAGGSRTEPSGVYLTLCTKAGDGVQSNNERPSRSSGRSPDRDEDEDEDHEIKNPVAWMAVSDDFGMNFTYHKMPAEVQASDLIIDPTSATSLYALAPPTSTQPNGCLSHSSTLGKEWSSCSKALNCTAANACNQLIIKDSKTMFMLRKNDVPLKTIDSGSTWSPLDNTPAKLTQFQTPDAAHPLGALSWSGKTLVVSGVDQSAIGRQERSSAVFKSTDDGESWTDETGDIITVSMGHGCWYEKDYYLVTGGEGIIVRRNFE